MRRRSKVLIAIAGLLLIAGVTFKTEDYGVMHMSATHSNKLALDSMWKDDTCSIPFVRNRCARQG